MLYNGRAQNGAGMKRLVSHFLRLSTRNTPNSAFCYILYIYIYIYLYQRAISVTSHEIVTCLLLYENNSCQGLQCVTFINCFMTSGITVSFISNALAYISRAVVGVPHG